MRQLAEVLAQAGRPERCTQPFPIGALDFARPFVQEELTPLYYTPLYRRLPAEQRRRYNQLSAMKVNEQFILLERELLDRIPRLIAHPRLREHPALRECLDGMLAEERAHLELIRRLNRACAPHLYAQRDHYFAAPARAHRWLSALAGAAPTLLVFTLWLQALIEEYTVGFARVMARGRDTPTLGALEPHFVRLHREHVKDEHRHVLIDLALLEAFRAGSGPLLRRLNAAALTACIRLLATPSTTLAVIRELVREYPELRRSEPALRAAVLALGADPVYLGSLFNRQLTPRTFAAFDAAPELQRLGRVLPAYAPRSPARGSTPG